MRSRCKQPSLEASSRANARGCCGPRGCALALTLPCSRPFSTLLPGMQMPPLVTRRAASREVGGGGRLPAGGGSEGLRLFSRGPAKRIVRAQCQKMEKGREKGRKKKKEKEGEERKEREAEITPVSRREHPGAEQTAPLPSSPCGPCSPCSPAGLGGSWTAALRRDQEAVPCYVTLVSSFVNAKGCHGE